jgi:hypothetical protein
MAFTVAAVPTGMNARVRISPRAMAMTPDRAAPSVAEMENVSPGIGRALSRAAADGTAVIASGNLRQ